MWGAGSRKTGNSALEIELRSKKVAANRERIKITKQGQLLERHWSQNLRKLSSLQRSIFVLMGKDPYPDICTREEALFEYNQPGFCYKRNGNPRLMRSLQESKTRKIVNDLEGHEGLTPEPAINVISDNPQMAEILSCPELVQILCELRNTAAIIGDESLLSQFAIALENSTRNPLMGFDGPLDYLKQYRKNLIQEFFDTLKIETDMRFFMAKDDPKLAFIRKTNSFQNAISTSNMALSDLVDGSEYTTRFQSAVDIGNLEAWNKAVIEGLRRAQEEEIKIKLQKNNPQMTGDEETMSKDKEQEIITNTITTDPSWTLQRYLKNLDHLSPLFNEKTIGLLTSRYLEDSKKEFKTPGLIKNITSSQLTTTNNNTAAGSSIAVTPNYNPHNNTPNVGTHHKQKRREFDDFVRHLISKIEILDEMGQHLLAFRRKRPNRHATLIDPLVKLLKKQSLFTSLTDADLRRLSAEDLEIEQIKREQPSVRYFNVPAENPPIPPQQKKKTSFNKITKSFASLAASKMEQLKYEYNYNNNNKNNIDFILPDEQQSPSLTRQDDNENVLLEQEAEKEIIQEQSSNSRRHVRFVESTASSARRTVRNGPSLSATTTTTTLPICSNTNNSSASAKCNNNIPGGPISIRRVSCRGCRAKVKMECTNMQQRDAICSKLKDAHSWRIPELSSWPHEYKDQTSAGIRARESVKSLSEISRKERMAKSVYLAPATPKSVVYQKGAPTPRRFPKNSTIPFPPDYFSLYPFGAQQNLKVQSTQSTVLDSAAAILTGASSKTAKTGTTMMSNSITKSGGEGTSFKMKQSGTTSSLGVKSTTTSTSETIPKRHADSWTLKVSTMDIMRLRHELEQENVKEKMIEFEQKFLNSETAKDKTSY